MIQVQIFCNCCRSFQVGCSCCICHSHNPSSRYAEDRLYSCHPPSSCSPLRDPQSNAQAPLDQASPEDPGMCHLQMHHAKLWSCITQTFASRFCNCLTHTAMQFTSKLMSCLTLNSQNTGLLTSYISPCCLQTSHSASQWPGPPRAH